MAHMHPQRIEDTANEGEKKVFEWLRTAPGTEDWHVLHSLRTGMHATQSEGECDFLVAIPGRGILDLEVKAWQGIRFFDNRWQKGERRSARGRGAGDGGWEWKPAEDPFAQAKGNAETVRGFLGRSSPDLRAVFVAGVVAFPYGTYAPGGIADFSWKTVDRAAFADGAPSAAETLCGVFDRCRGRVLGGSPRLREALERSPFTPERAAAAVQALLSEVYVTDPRAYSRETAKDRMKAWTGEQLNVLRYQLEDNPRVYVPSAAGTGKTIVAIESVRRLSRRHPDWRIGFFCFNDLLGEDLADPGRFQRPSGGGRIESGTIYKFAMETGGLPAARFDKWSARTPEQRERLLPAMRELLAAGGIADEGGDETVPLFFNRLVPERFLAAAEKKGPVFDYLVLDEVQDFLTKPFFEALGRLLKGGFRDGRWLVCGDYENQSVQNHRDRPVLNLLDPALDLRPSVCRLTVNCRNPHGISAEISANVGPSPEYRETLRFDERRGADVVPCDTSDFGAVSARVRDAVLAFRAEGFADEDILVLFQSSKAMEGWAAHLSAHPAPDVGFRPFRIKKNPSGVRYMTIRRFKGLDHPAVVLVLKPGARVPEGRTANADVDSSLLYVGMSRATFRLCLVAPEPFARDYLRPREDA